MNITRKEINSIFAIAVRRGVDLDSHPLAQLANSDFWTNLSPKDRNRCTDQMIDELGLLADALDEDGNYVNAAVIRSVIAKLEGAHETN